MDSYNCQDIIDKCAEEGKRYVGWIPETIDRDNGRIKEITLIFEKSEPIEPNYQKYLDKRGLKP